MKIVKIKDKCGTALIINPDSIVTIKEQRFYEGDVGIVISFNNQDVEELVMSMAEFESLRICTFAIVTKELKFLRYERSN